MENFNIKEFLEHKMIPFIAVFFFAVLCILLIFVAMKNIQDRNKEQELLKMQQKSDSLRLEIQIRQQLDSLQKTK